MTIPVSMWLFEINRPEGLPQEQQCRGRCTLKCPTRCRNQLESMGSTNNSEDPRVKLKKQEPWWVTILGDVRTHINDLDNGLLFWGQQDRHYPCLMVRQEIILWGFYWETDYQAGRLINLTLGQSGPVLSSFITEAMLFFPPLNISSPEGSTYCYAMLETKQASGSGEVPSFLS